MALDSGVLGQSGLVEYLGYAVGVLGADVLVDVEHRIAFVVHFLKTCLRIDDGVSLGGEVPHLLSVFGVDAGEDRCVVHHRLAYYISYEGVGNLPAVESVEELGHFLLVEAERGVGVEEIVASLEDVESEGDVDTAVPELTYVGVDAAET